MRLVRKESVLHKKLIVTAELMSLQENKPLARMLSIIASSGLAGLKDDDKLKTFASGLINNFVDAGYINKQGKLLEAGVEIVNTEKEWKELYGDFQFDVITKGNYSYIVDCKPLTIVETYGLTQIDNIGNAFDGEYENNKGMKIKNIKLGRSGFESDQRSFTIDCVYDYEKDTNSYVVVLEGKKIEFPENIKTFKLVDSANAVSMLRSALSNYCDLTYSGGKIYISECSDNIPIMNYVYNSVLETGMFDIDLEDYQIKNIRLNISDQSIATNVLMKYLMNNAEKKYCGYGEIAKLIAEFYDKFETCNSIDDTTQTIYTKLIQCANDNNNRTAYLRLRAYEDLMPDNIASKYQTTGVIDLSNRDISISDLVEYIVGNETVTKVTTLTKYAYRNASISRAMVLFADALKRKYNVGLNVITCKDVESEQSEVARKYFRELERAPGISVQLRDFNDIRKVHDRYYKIELQSGDIKWVKMTGELDALKYNGDFTDGRTPNENITLDSRARVKEMTLVGVEAKGINPLVAKIMEG